MQKVFIFTVVILTLILFTACTSSKKPVDTNPEDILEAIFSDSDIQQAKEELETDIEEIVLPEDVEEEETTEVTEVDLELNENPAPGAFDQADGNICYVRKKAGAAKPWQIFVFDQKTEQGKLVFEGTFEIQSVACNAEANFFLLAMQEPEKPNVDFEMFTLNSETKEVKRLTKNSGPDLNASMSDDGKVMVWETLIRGKRTIRIKRNNKRQSLRSKFDQFEPSVSTNGTFIVFVRDKTTTNREQIIRFNLVTGELKRFRSVPANPNRHLRHPSITDDGNRAMWLLEIKDGSNLTNIVKFRNRNGVRTFSRVIKTSDKVKHPHMTHNGKWVTFIRNEDLFIVELATGNTRKGSVSDASIERFAPYWAFHPEEVPPIGNNLAGTINVNAVNIAQNESVKVAEDVIIKVAGDVIIDGELVADGAKGQSITIEAEGSITINGRVVAGLAGETASGGSITLNSANGNITLGKDSQVTAGDGKDGVLPLNTLGVAAPKLEVQQDDTTVIKGGAGTKGGDVALTAAKGTLTITEGAKIHLGNGGNGLDIAMDTPDLLEVPPNFNAENGGGSSGGFDFEASTVVGIDTELFTVEEDFPPIEPIVKKGEVVTIINNATDFMTGGKGGDAGAIDVDLQAAQEAVLDKVSTSERKLSKLAVFGATAIANGTNGADGYFEVGNGGQANGRGLDGDFSGANGQNIIGNGGNAGKCKFNKRSTALFNVDIALGGGGTITAGNGKAGRNPNGKGGNGGDATLNFGDPALCITRRGTSGREKAFFGQAIVTAGNAGNGGNACPNTSSDAGDGGIGGSAIARFPSFESLVEVSSILVKLKAGDGGNGGDAPVPFDFGKGDFGGPAILENGEQASFKDIKQGTSGKDGTFCIVAALEVTPKSATVPIGGSKQYAATFINIKSEVKNVTSNANTTWSTTGTVSTISQTGGASAKGEFIGSDVITAKHKDPDTGETLTATATFTVEGGVNPDSELVEPDFFSFTNGTRGIATRAEGSTSITIRLEGLLDTIDRFVGVSGLADEKIAELILFLDSLSAKSLSPQQIDPDNDRVFKVTAKGSAGQTISGFVGLSQTRKFDTTINLLASGKPLNELTFIVDILDSTATGTITISVQDGDFDAGFQRLDFDPSTKQLVFDLQSMADARPNADVDFDKITFANLVVNFGLTADGEQSVTIDTVTGPEDLEITAVPSE